MEKLITIPILGEKIEVKHLVDRSYYYANNDLIEKHWKVCIKDELVSINKIAELEDGSKPAKPYEVSTYADFLTGTHNFEKMEEVLIFLTKLNKRSWE